MYIWTDALILSYVKMSYAKDLTPDICGQNFKKFRIVQILNQYLYKLHESIFGKC